ncbi:MAG TPA: cobyric acid synthase [Candidatus Binataceae bacterium]|nr:cobyric acid synthase [Candidatus Binataceae bacterium]
MAAKSLMVMGTASDAGKSLVVTGLCRALARRGIKVAPFKSQNMSNNAAVCTGGEIGRAQAAQAEACGLTPTLDMNPVLLKPEAERGVQVVIHGRARFHMTTEAGEFERYREQAWPAIAQSYRQLATAFDVILIEGAGGAAEINLRHRDLANWAVAELADAPVLLVGDIDKGGVFASLVGTVMLLSEAERARLAGMLINKFRGDARLLGEGPAMLQARTGVPLLGVIPYLRLAIPQEDSAALSARPIRLQGASLTAGVIHFPRISNYTDFAPLEEEPDVGLDYYSDPNSAPPLDLLFLPGSKSTIADLDWLRAIGWESYLARHRARGGWIVGICGGYQMLGQRILDPDGVESVRTQAVGLGLLELETRFEPDKITRAVAGHDCAFNLPIGGYEIHAGRIAGPDLARPLFTLAPLVEQAPATNEGAQSEDGRVIGTTMHGLFDRAQFRRAWLNQIRRAKGLSPMEARPASDAHELRARAYEELADALERSCEIERILKLIL